MEACALCWDKVPKTEILYGTAWGVTGKICKECVHYVGNADFKESLVPATTTYNYSSVADWDWSVYQDVWDGPMAGAVTHTYTGLTAYPMCSHHMVPFMFEGLDNAYTVHLSGSSHLKDEPSIKELPTIGVYLDDGWLSGRLASNTSGELDARQPSSLYVGWPDFGCISTELLHEAIEWVLPYLRDKESIIEIACQGGHGRTGAFLAALLVREGWAPTDAIEYIRGGYCRKALETKLQEELVTDYQNLIAGVVPNESSS